MKIYSDIFHKKNKSPEKKLIPKAKPEKKTSRHGKVFPKSIGLERSAQQQLYRYSIHLKIMLFLYSRRNEQKMRENV